MSERLVHAIGLGVFKLPCGCVIQRLSNQTEEVLKQCDCCATEFNDRHAAAADSAQVRADLTPTCGTCE